MTTATLFNLKKANPKGACDANRCTDAPHATTDGVLWGLAEVRLCAKHLSIAMAFAEANPDYVAMAADDVPSTAALTRTPVEVVALPPTWLDRAYEIVGEIQGSEAEAKEELVAAKAFTIDNQDDFDLVAAFVREVKTRRDRYETLEKELTQPLNLVIKRIRFLLASAKNTWTEVESQLRGKLKQATLREAERNSKLLAEAAATHAVGGDATVAVAQMTTSSDLDGVSAKLVWKPIIEDVTKMPDEYVIRIPDTKKLNDYAKSFGGKEPEPIEGVRFERDVNTRVQSVKN